MAGDATKSSELRTLEKNLDRLRKSLLPRQFDPTGSYRYHRQVSARTLAYRLMVHAEFEDFLERRCKAVAKKAMEPVSG